MKIVWITNSPTQPTGFGQQAGLVARELKKLGHENIFICRPHPVQEMEFEEVHIENYRWPAFDIELSRIQPDAVIVFDGHRFLIDTMDIEATPANCPMYFWFPFEGSSRPVDFDDIFAGLPPENLIHLSEFAKDLWKHGDTVISHCVSEDFKPLGIPKNELRRKWSKKLKLPILENSLLLFNVNRNFFHKGWDELFYLISLVKKSKEVQLICHTTPVVDEKWGGYNLKDLAKMYGVEDEVLFTEQKLTTSEMNEFWNMVDLRVDTSHGEGFGLTNLEARSAGCPQIVTDHTTMKEILGVNDLLIPPASFSYRMGSTWAQPDVAEMAREILLPDVQGNILAPDTIPKKFSREHIAHQWQSVLSRKVDCWKHHRFGYHKQVLHKPIQQSAARLCEIMKWSALDVGSYDGEFIEWCLKFNVKCKGVDTAENTGSLSNRLSGHINIVQNYSDPWPEEYHCLVINSLDNILGDPDPKIVSELLARIQEYNAVMFLERATFKWGKPRFNPNQFREYLRSAGLEKREDLKILVKKKLPSFEHEVWTLDSVIPNELK